MLTFLFNRFHTISDHAPREIPEAGLTAIGLSSEIPPAMRREMAAAAKVALYDPGLSLEDCASAKDGAARRDRALDDAAALGAQRVLASIGRCCDAGRGECGAAAIARALRERCAARGMELMLTNRRPFDPAVPVSAEKLARLCAASETPLAFDVGASHASMRALEDFWDLREQIGALLLNDNFGREALCPVGHEDYEPGVFPDDMRQPGYGSAPWVRLMERAPEVPMFINGSRHGGAPLAQVLLETRVLLSGRVFVNPAGGRFGMGADGRLII